MAACEFRQLRTSASEKGIGRHQDRRDTQLAQGFKSRVDVALTARRHYMDFQAIGASRLLHGARLRVGLLPTGVHEVSNRCGCRKQLVQNLHALGGKKTVEEVNAGDVAAWAIETRNKAASRRIIARYEHDRNCRGCSLQRLRRCRGSAGNDDCDASPRQIRSHRRKPLVVPVRPIELDNDALALDEAGFAEPLAEAGQASALPSADPVWRRPTTGIGDCCPRATSGHAAAPPSSVMNSRRFTAQYLPCFRQKGYHTSVRQETAALRDFDRPDDRVGVMYGRRPRCKRNLTISEAFGCGHVFGL